MGRSNKILIDTNILIYMYENQKDIFDAVTVLIPEAEFYVLNKTYNEIEKVFKDKPRKKEMLIRYLKKVEAKGKYKIIDVPNEIVDKSERYQKIDNLLIYYSKDYIIYTNDRILKEKLKIKHAKIITLKTQGAILE
jgi:rRNA-processing protein FCF1